MRSLFVMAIILAGGFGTSSPSAPAGGGGGTPGGVSGNIQVNNAGTFGPYAGSNACTYAIKTFDASGVASCTAAPVIPAPAGTAAEIQKRATATTFGVATSGVDYAPATSGTSILAGNGSGGFLNAVAGSDYQAPLPTPTSGGVLYGGGLTYGMTAAGLSGQVLTSNGTAAPTWQAAAAGGGSGPTKLCGFRFGAAAASSGNQACTAAETFYCLVNVASYSASDIVSFRFNGDATTTNYASSHVGFSNASTPVVARTSFTTSGQCVLARVAATTGRHVRISCQNVAASRKNCTIQSVLESTSQSTISEDVFGHCEYFNTSTQITQIDMRTNGGSATMGVGSGFVCYGGTPP